MPSTANNKQRALQTLLYSDLFSFPLTLDEMYRYWEGGREISKPQIERVLRSLFPFVKEKHGYYFFSGKEKIVSRREHQRKHLEQKLRIAETTARVLALIPSVQFIGISGSVAVGSAASSDDIDFFIITCKNTLFSTRFFVLGLLQLLGKRRKRTASHERNKICVNMLIEESTMGTERSRQDIYSAREIAQLLPLFERDATYKRFFMSNKWIKQYLPNADPKTIRYSVKSHRLWQWFFSTYLFQLFEKTMRFFQKRSIMLHRSTETITDTYLAFHPLDYRARTLKEREKRLAALLQESRSSPLVIDEHFLDKAINIFYTA